MAIILGTIGEALELLPDAKECATYKGVEIAKAISPFKRKSIGDFEVQMVIIEPIEGGISYFIRAWGTDGKQIGFGKDGTVDIERIKVYNPWINMPDGTTYTVKGPNGIEYEEKNLREDVEGAVLYDLNNTLLSKKQMHDDSKIIPGKIGKTTATLYTVAGANSPCDGRVLLQGVNDSFTNVRNTASGTSINVTQTAVYNTLNCAAGSPNFQGIDRGIFNFDTSVIDTGEIASVTLTLYIVSEDHPLDDDVMHIEACTPAGTNTIATGDYDSFVGVSFASKAMTAMNTSSYNNIWTFNGAGETAINKSGITSLMTRFGWDYGNSFTGSWIANNSNVVAIRTADAGSDEPKLTIEYEEAASGADKMFMMF